MRPNFTIPIQKPIPAGSSSGTSGPLASLATGEVLFTKQHVPRGSTSVMSLETVGAIERIGDEYIHQYFVPFATHETPFLTAMPSWGTSECYWSTYNLGSVVGTIGQQSNILLPISVAETRKIKSISTSFGFYRSGTGVEIKFVFRAYKISSTGALTQIGTTIEWSSTGVASYSDIPISVSADPAVSVVKGDKIFIKTEGQVLSGTHTTSNYCRISQLHNAGYNLWRFQFE